MKRVLHKLTALALGLGLSLLVLEAAVRILRPGEYRAPTLTTMDGETLADLSGVIGLLQDVQAGGSPRERVRTALTPNEVVMGCYDRPRWDYFDENGCVEYKMNSLGFRDLEFSQDKPAGEFRVIALGDSFTFGVGVQLQDTWAQQLERVLQAERHGPVEVINCGFVAGHKPPAYLQWIREEAMKLQPDVVIVGLCLNDMGGIPMMAYDAREDSCLSKLWGLIKRRLHSYRVERALARQETAKKSKAKAADFVRVIRNDPRDWNATQRALLKSKAFLEQRGVRFAVAILPMLSELHREGRYAPLHQMVTRFALKNGLEVIDCGPPFLGLEESELWAHPTDQHPNDVGQAMLARSILASLRVPR
ncbi:MAG: hypothetical protein DRQ55_04655 [Planctomycetota bacterium]|nr:MAG: hypothetical protein DRQ55_04655 [Planctomycetota bacterium]